ncbi:MAG: amino acid permease [Parachlamydiales bacterium]|nr:amino acid permease [Parachlamydiales bacterium]
MEKGIFAKKTIESLLKDASNTKHGFKRALGPLNLIGIGIGAIIGAGLFVLTGDAAASAAGPGVIISFLIAALVCFLAALCYAEFASLIPIAGSAYTYAYVAMGEFFAWIMGLALTLEYLFSFCTVAVGWSGYFNSLLRDLGLEIPSIISKAPLLHSSQSGWVLTNSIVNLPAMIIIGLIGWLVSRGIQTAAFLNNLLVYVKVGVIIIFIGCGLAYIRSDHLIPFIPQNTGFFGEFGWSGIFRGAGIVFFAFVGFDSVSTLAQEAKKPQRSLPIGMLGSLAICTLIYIVFGFVLTGAANYRTLGVEDSIAVAVRAFGPNFTWLRYVVNFAILSGLTSVILVMIMGQARVFYAMAHDGLLPRSFGKIHDRLGTPFFSTMVVTIIGMIIAGCFPIGILGKLTSMGALLAFGMVCFGVLILRFSQPKLHRPFKTPWSPLVPLLGTLSCLILMVLMPFVIWIQLFLFLAIGCAIYFLYSAKNSKIRNGL